MIPPRPLLVVLTGPSGAGKDAILDELARRGARFHRAVTCTTRPPRTGERDGIDYHFVSDAEFDRLIEAGGLLEHADVYLHRSGVSKQQVLDQLARDVDVFIRTDVQGAATIKRLMPEAVTVFIAPSSVEELEARVRQRASDDEERVARRLATARDEMARRHEFDHLIVNKPGELEATADRMNEVIDAERSRRGARA